MNRTNVCYEKAFNYYSKGYIDKALEYCEKCISIDLKNKAAIDLKGLLYYLKGDLTNAKALWKLNLQYNKDGAAKKYLECIKEDEERFNLYVKALNNIKELKINEALALLEKCEESDYNLINVNNHMTICYIKKGDFQKAIERIEKVFKVDRQNEVALENKKLLINLGVIKKEINKGLVFKGIGVILFILIAINYKSLTKTFNGFRDKIIKKEAVTANFNIKTDKTNNNSDKAGSKKKNINASKEQIQNKAEVFPLMEFKNSLEAKDFNKLYDYVSSWKNNSTLDINNKSVLIQGEKLLMDYGVEYFYENATASFNNKDYLKAEKEFSKAYEYGNNSYLYPHIVFFLASSYKNSGDVENALKYYVQYDESFQKGNYEETVLYQIVMLNKDINPEKAKLYAKKLSDRFPQSMYNNSNIKNLLAN